MADPVEALLLSDAPAWGEWLLTHHSASPGIWLVLARKGSEGPTTLTYDDALLDALCWGWIDGQKRSRDGETFLQRFTPRRARSRWSRRNVELAEELIAAGRMQAAGLLEVEKAKVDGRWSDAYAGQRDVEIPDDLAAALAANADARAMFDILTSQNRYAIIFRITDAKRADTRARRIEQYVDMLARGETLHPQRRTLDS